MVNDLALQIGDFDGFVIDQSESSYASSRKVDCRGRTETADSDNEDPGGFEFLLSFLTHLWKDKVARISFAF